MNQNSDNRVPAHPGTTLLEKAMKPLGISRNELARDIDVPVGRISDITNGKRGISADTALRLGRYFGTPPELWLRLQSAYDLHVARSTSWPGVEPRVRVLRRPEGGGEDALESNLAPANPLAVPGEGGDGRAAEDVTGAVARAGEFHPDDEDLSIPPSPQSDADGPR